MQLPKGVRLGPWVKDMDFEQPYNIKWLQRNSARLVNDNVGWKIITDNKLLVLSGTKDSVIWAQEKVQLWGLKSYTYNDNYHR